MEITFMLFFNNKKQIRTNFDLRNSSDLLRLVKRSKINPNHTTAVFSLSYLCTPPIIGSGNLPLVTRTGIRTRACGWRLRDNEIRRTACHG